MGYKPMHKATYIENLDYTKTKRDFSDTRFLASCGKWFLMIDSRSRLFIIDVFNGKTIELPPLESVVSNIYTLKRVEGSDKVFKWELDTGYKRLVYADEIRGRLWVDEETNELALAWFFDASASFVCFYKNGNAHYDSVSVRFGIPKILEGLFSLVLRGYRLYILTFHLFLRVIDFSGEQGFHEVPTDRSPSFCLVNYNCQLSIAVKTSGEVLMVETGGKLFRIYKKDSDADPDAYMFDLIEVDSLGNEALLLDLGIIVPANHTFGIKPNSIYFTRDDLIREVIPKRQPFLNPYVVNICVYDLSTKTLKSFPATSNMKLKDARWIFSLT